MKRFLFSIMLLNLVLLSINAQYTGYGITVKSMDGSSKPLTSYINTDEGHVTLFVFWKTCCPTNLNMIDSLFELTDEYGNSNDISVVLVSVDDIRTTDRVFPVVRTKGWKADVIQDVKM